MIGRTTVLLACAMTATVADANQCDEYGRNGQVQSHRIVGGIEADDSVSGWQVSLRLHGQHFCGGSLIHTDPDGDAYVLTAAHCLTGSELTERPNPAFTVGYGSRDRERVRDFPVTRIHVQPDWNGDSGRGGDIAVLRLQGSPEAPVYVSLPGQARYDQSGRCAVVTGWGSMDRVDPRRRSQPAQRSGAPRMLQAVSVPLVDGGACARAYGELGLNVGADQICAGLQSGGRDSCQGDSGGPLTVFDGARRVQVGVVSWGAGCAGQDAYGVYTEVRSYVPWINSCVKGESRCPEYQGGLQ